VAIRERHSFSDGVGAASGSEDPIAPEEWKPWGSGSSRLYHALTSASRGSVLAHLVAGIGICESAFEAPTWCRPRREGLSGVVRLPGASERWGCKTTSPLLCVPSYEAVLRSSSLERAPPLGAFDAVRSRPSGYSSGSGGIGCKATSCTTRSWPSENRTRQVRRYRLAAVALGIAVSPQVHQGLLCVG
jgi:hypothetical protein